jgi:predicted nucleotidyltransferase component of viral defense system
VIDRGEIEAKAAEFGINTSNLQRDYVFGWLISGLYRESALQDTLVLKGGNALRKAYLPETRFSADLDFTTAAGLQPGNLVEHFNDICRFAAARTGVAFDIDRNRIVEEHLIDDTKRAYKMRLYFRDFSGNANHLTLSIRLDVTEYDRLRLPIQTRSLIHPYSDAADCHAEIRVVKLEEALADKLTCLLSRRHAFDLFDLVYAVFVENNVRVNHGEMVHTFLRKSAFDRSPATARDLLLGPLDPVEQFWNRIVCPKATLFSFDRAMELMTTGIAKMFAPFNYGARHSAAYFPAHLRNAILQAATDLTMLRLWYRGHERLVEPYALAFSVRQSDGVGQEYFWAYDRTGGGSGPGIKSFVRHGIQGLQNTTVPFQPRYAVELAKAPTRAGVSTFSKRAPMAGHRRIRTARRPSAGTGPTYIVQCPGCQKTFTRKTSSTSLNPHKDRQGYRCVCRSGYRI